MDVLFTRYSVSVFKGLNPLWWDPMKSWKNKWKSPLQPPTKKWYYFGFLPENEEKFPFSSTILVFLTDAWHLAKFLMLIFISLSIVLYNPIISPMVDWFIYYIGWTIPFTFFYSKILVKD